MEPAKRDPRSGAEPTSSDKVVEARNNDLSRLAQATDLVERWTCLRSTASDDAERGKLDELKKMLLQLIRRELALALLQGGVMAMAPPPDELTDEELEELRRNAQAWKADEEACRRKTGLCGGAIEWVRKHGRFAPAGSGKTFGQAMGLAGGQSLEAAFRLAKLLGLLAQESSFGTNLGTSDTYKGPFQLSRDVVDDFNRHNDPDVQWPDDVDSVEDFETAAKVAAWYLAFILQQLTFRPDPGPIEDPEEANKFALAAYNGGMKTIQDARKRAKAAGKNPDLWDEVKEFLPDGTERERNKKREILDYVRRIRAYERLARELGCVP
jgi:Transglycosylase SLT domain